MGYTTEFAGQFDLDRSLAPAHAEYLRAFAETRRMKRDADALAGVADPKREAAGLPVGPEGVYFVGGDGSRGQGGAGGVVNYNAPPEGQPGLWCQWVPTHEGDGIEWDGGEEFYPYVEWLEYLVSHLLAPWGYVLNGEVEWRGEDWGDVGRIVVRDNVVSTACACSCGCAQCGERVGGGA